MAVLTYERLKEHGACREQLALFKRKYGESVVVTVEAAQEVAGEFDWLWARRLLDAPAWAAYEAATASASAAYEAATASAWAAYEAATASASAAYEAATAPAWARAFIESEARKEPKA